MKTLHDLCVPRASVFDMARLDTVYNLDDLLHIKPNEFFSENFVTEGMRILLTEAFNRLEGKTSSASGTFLLSQSMGGGKTHNLIALGLLAKYPEYRKKVMSSFYTPGSLGTINVVSFSGRNTNTPFGLWGEISEQLNKKTVFNEYYSPLKPPSPDKWVELLRGEPILILLDELPAYFEAAKAVAVGDTYLDRLTTSALANLLVAINGNKLPRACIVLTDLSGTAYVSGGVALSQAIESLGNLEQEVNRNVIRIDPVKINTNELYHILRTRIFEGLPDESEISEVADAYGEAANQAKVMDITTASPDQLKTDIRSAYPFHPAIRDLYARFKENRGFQQTRALIRIMRTIVSDLWNVGKAKSCYIIGAQDFDLLNASMLAEIRQINPSLEVAIAHDIVSEGGSAIAQQIDKEGHEDAQNIAKLIFLSSLSTATSPVHGLSRSEIAGYLASPGRDNIELRSSLDRLQTDAWYIHASRDGKLFFKNVENLNAKLASYTKNKLREQREKELRDRLAEMFKITTRAAYQKLLPLPAIDQIQLHQDLITLVIFRPSEDSFTAIEDFYKHQQFKNRVCFLTGAAKPYETVLERAAELSAIKTIIREMYEQGIRETDPQFTDAAEIQAKLEGRFYQACRETFTILYYPTADKLNQIELDPKYVANEYKGEEQVLNALKECYKYTIDIAPDGTFRNRVENKLWPASAKEVAWSTIKLRAATDPSWVWHHPDALDNLREELVRRDIWRQTIEFIARGPFEKPSTSVQVIPLSRDEQTGETTLRVRPLNGDTIHIEENDDATTASKKLETFDIKTKALKLSFLCIDSKIEHATGNPVGWKNTIKIKYRFFQEGKKRKCELRAIPKGTIKFTVDGSSPETSGIVYSESLEIPEGCNFIIAVAEDEDVHSDQITIPAPKGKVDLASLIDKDKQSIWRRAIRKDSTGECYKFMEIAKKYGAEVGGMRLTVAKDNHWIELNTSEEDYRGIDQLTKCADLIKQFLPEGNLSLDVSSLNFDTGQQLLDMIAEMKTELKEGEVRQ
jgi:hypothetical protein